MSKQVNRKQNPITDLSLFGKIPPQATDIERLVLGTVLLDNNTHHEVFEALDENSFYIDAHKHLFLALKMMYDNGQPIDLLSCVHKLKSLGLLEIVGGAYYISECTNEVASTANIEYHCRLLTQFQIKRMVIEIANKAMQQSYDDTTDCFDVLNEAMSQLSLLEVGIKASNIEQVDTIAVETIAEIHKKINDRRVGVKNIIPTFSEALDQKTGGWINVCVIGGLPGSGKTAALLESVRRCLNDGLSVGVISLEMSKTQLISRMLSSMAKVDGIKIRDGYTSDMEFEQIKAAADRLIREKLFIADDGYINDVKLRPMIRNFVKKHKCQVVFLDFLQLMDISHSKGKKVDDNEDLMKKMQKISKEFSIPIVVLSQLARYENRPTINSLRHGGIEQSSDIIVLMHDINYNNPNVEIQDNPSSEMIAIAAKSKHGSISDVKITFHKQYQTIQDGHVGATQNYSTMQPYTKETAMDIPNQELF